MSNKKVGREEEGHRLATVACPVAVHRWFSSGEGWAYSPGADGVLEVEEIERVLSRRDRTSDGDSGLLRHGKECVVYYLELDHDPADPKAAGRSPSILRTVVLPEEPRATFVPSLIAQLREMTLPDHPGEIPNLVLHVPQDWFGPRRFLAACPRRPNLPQCKWILSRRLRLMCAIVLIGALLSAIIGCSICSVSTKDVYESLLEPIGVKLENTNSSDAVADSLAMVYCKRGMIQHYCPNKSDEDIATLEHLLEIRMEESTVVSSGSSSIPCDGSRPLHPDSVFVRDVAEPFLQKLAAAIRWLPDSHQVPSPQLISLGNKLARTVNAIAANIPRQERERLFPERSVLIVGRFGNRLLHKAVVEKLKDLKPIDVEGYPQWFAKWSWESSGGFPWDTEPSEQTRLIVLLFTPEQPQGYPEDEVKAATKMVTLLRKWGVKGVTEDDASQRPWFVGRCFIEFLSLKHLGLTKEERESLDKGDTFVSQCLKNLPNEGWVTASDENVSTGQMWQFTQQRLKQLARRLDISNESDPAIVESIGKKIQEWKNEFDEGQLSIQEKRNRVQELATEIKDYDTQLGKLDSATQAGEYREIELKRSESRDKQNKLLAEIRYFEKTGNKSCDNFWERLTGSSDSINEGSDQ